MSLMARTQTLPISGKIACVAGVCVRFLARVRDRDREEKSIFFPRVAPTRLSRFPYARSKLRRLLRRLLERILDQH